MIEWSGRRWGPLDADQSQAVCVVGYQLTKAHWFSVPGQWQCTGGDSLFTGFLQLTSPDSGKTSPLNFTLT